METEMDAEMIADQINSVKLNYTMEDRNLLESEVSDGFVKQNTIFHHDGENLKNQRIIPSLEFGSLKKSLEFLIEQTFEICRRPDCEELVTCDISGLVYKGCVHFLCSDALNSGLLNPDANTSFTEAFKFHRYSDQNFNHFLRRVEENHHRCSLSAIVNSDSAELRNLYLNRKLDDVEFTVLDAYVIADAFQAELKVYYMTNDDCYSPNYTGSTVDWKSLSYNRYNFNTPNGQKRPVWTLLSDFYGVFWCPFTEELTPDMFYYYNHEHTASTILRESHRSMLK
jgi:hypothetical protein